MSWSADDLAAAIAQGRAAAARPLNQRRRINPFPQQPELAEAWDRGYDRQLTAARVKLNDLAGRCEAEALNWAGQAMFAGLMDIAAQIRARSAALK